MKPPGHRLAQARSDDSLQALRINPDRAKLPLFDRAYAHIRQYY